MFTMRLVGFFTGDRVELRRDAVLSLNPFRFTGRFEPRAGGCVLRGSFAASAWNRALLGCWFAVAVAGLAASVLAAVTGPAVFWFAPVGMLLVLALGAAVALVNGHQMRRDQSAITHVVTAALQA